MKKKYFYMTIVLLMSLLFAISSQAFAQNKAIKLSAKTMTLQVGQTKVLKIKNGYPNIRWDVISGKKVIELSMTEQYQTSGDAYAYVRGVRSGRAVVQATVGKKKLKCSITVKQENFQKKKPGGFWITIAAEGKYNPSKKGYGFNFSWKTVTGADGYRLYKVKGSKKILIKDIKGGNVCQYARKSLQVSGKELSRGKVRLQIVAYKMQNGKRIYSKAVTTGKYMVCI